MDADLRQRLAEAIDHTEIHPDATEADILRTCAEAREFGFGAVCVAGVRVEAAARALQGAKVNLVSIAGFPLGAVDSAAKATEAAAAVARGANEIDMVISVGHLKEGRFDRVRDDIRQVKTACSGRTLKVIIECGLLTEDEIEAACEAIVDAGGDFVKTSTGVYSRGATVDDVLLLRRLVGDRARVKASGGIRTREQALALLEAGADRLGTSSGVAILRDA